MMAEQVGKFLGVCKTPSMAHDIILAVFSEELSNLEPFYLLKHHCLERGLISFETTIEGLARYRLTARGLESLETYEALLSNDEAADTSLSLVNY